MHTNWSTTVIIANVATEQGEGTLVGKAQREEQQQLSLQLPVQVACSSIGQQAAAVVQLVTNA